MGKTRDLQENERIERKENSQTDPMRLPTP